MGRNYPLFGALLYEMVTGRRAFQGNSQASVMAKILETDPPPMSSLQPVTPQALERMVRKCLAKDPDRRWQSASDLYDNLQWIKESSAQPASVTSPQPGGPISAVTTSESKLRRMLPWTVAAVLAIAAVIAALFSKPPAPQPVTRLAITLPPGQHLAALDQPAIAISPDGKNIVYVAVPRAPTVSEGPFRIRAPTDKGPLANGRGSDSNAVQQLYLRPLDSLESKPIAGTEGATGPFFSPDGEWIGFFAGGKLMKVSVNGGAAVTLASAPQPGGASWSSQGTLAFQPTTAAQGLQQVSQEGGTPQSLTRIEKAVNYYRWPEFLPNGKGVLFASSQVLASWINAQIAVRPAAGGERKNLAQGTQPRYAATGHLLYAQSGTLMAAPFDARRIFGDACVTGLERPAYPGMPLRGASRPVPRPFPWNNVAPKRESTPLLGSTKPGGGALHARPPPGPASQARWSPGRAV